MIEPSIVYTTSSSDDSKLLDNCEGIRFAFSVGPLNATLCKTFYTWGITTILCTETPRRLHSSWYRFSLWVEHKLYGGVTDATPQFYLLSTHHHSTRNLQHLHHSRDASTIVEDSVWCTRCRMKPSTLPPSSLKVVNLGTDKNPLIHIGGLLPLSTLLSCTVITPAIGLKSGLWGIRRLTSLEKLLARTCPRSYSHHKFLEPCY